MSCHVLCDSESADQSLQTNHCIMQDYECSHEFAAQACIYQSNRCSLTIFNMCMFGRTAPVVQSPVEPSVKTAVAASSLHSLICDTRLLVFTSTHVHHMQADCISCTGTSILRRTMLQVSHVLNATATAFMTIGILLCSIVVSRLAVNKFLTIQLEA